MAFTINPANYTFKKDEAVIIRYEGASIDYGYLYGVKGVINSTSGTSTTLTFPPIETLGTYTCYVGTYIGADWTKSNNFTITITDSTAPPTNNPPTISYFDGSGSSTGAYSVNYTISDADNDTMAVSLKVDNNSYFSLGSKTGGTYNYNGTGLSVGNHALTLRVSDGKSETTKSCSVTITDSQPTNNPPVIGSVKVSETNYSGGYVLTYTATDRDNDTLYHRLKVDSGSYVSINPSKSGDSYRYAGSGLTTGTHTGIIQVTDGKATVNSSSFSISIPERPTSVKAELKQAKDNYDAKHENLKRIIAEIIADNLYDEATEKAKYDNAFSEYAQALAKYEEVCNKAIENISKNNADAISEALRSEIQGNIDDVTEIANKVKDDLQGFTADGILSEAEKEAIRKSVLILKTEKKDIDAQYTSLYSNTDLTGTPKTELKTAYDNYVSRYNALDVEISRLLKLTTITESDRVSFNSAFDSHDTALAGYSQKANLAIDKIAEKKKDDAIDESNKYTDTSFEILDGKISSKITSAEAKSIAEQTVNGFKFEVSQTYPTKDDLNTIKNKLTADIESVNAGVSNLEDILNGGLEDGILTEAEKMAIKKSLEQLERENANISIRYTEIYSNKNLT